MISAISAERIICTDDDIDDFVDDIVHHVGDESDRLEVKLQSVLFEVYAGDLLSFAVDLVPVVEKGACKCKTRRASCRELRATVNHWADEKLGLARCQSKTFH